LVDDTWANLMALQNNLNRIQLEGMQIKVNTCIDGEKAIN